MEEIATASEEQRSGVGQINTALMQLNEVIQHNASASEEGSSPVASVSACAWPCGGGKCGAKQPCE